MTKSKMKVRQRWNTLNYNAAQNIAQANVRIEEFARAGKSSQSMEATQQYLSTHHHKVKTINGQEFYMFPGQSTYKNDKQRQAGLEQMRRFLKSDVGTLEKSEKLLRKQYDTFCENHGVNKRVLTFSKYKELFENYEKLYDFQYEDSDRVIRAVLEHSFKEGWSATVRGEDSWLKGLLEKLSSADKKEVNEAKEIVDSWFYESVYDVHSKGWIENVRGFTFDKFGH